MAAMTNILVKDDTVTTPVEFTLFPVTDTPHPLWRANVAGVPIDGQLRLSNTVEKLKNGSYKITVKLESPTLETLGASGTSSGYVAPAKVAYVTTGIFTMFADKRSTIADRVNCLRFIMGYLQGASSTTATGVLANTAAGQAWSTSTLPGPLLFSSLILPN
jgi:hypothetical protein